MGVHPLEWYSLAVLATFQATYGSDTWLEARLQQQQQHQRQPLDTNMDTDAPVSEPSIRQRRGAIHLSHALRPSSREDGPQEDLFIFCGCRGQHAFTHISCLENWRAARRHRRLADRCELCGEPYALEDTMVFANRARQAVMTLWRQTSEM
mmetsp:Transcript_113453/g.225834  ORF Transcript_113453/g.225834 Transcript_113453/m.225834 type:complete len:151 (+) Transcript_113453:33-485(+)